MKRYLACAVALIAAVVVLVVLPLGAGASSDKRFVLGEQGTFTGDTTGGGTFAVSGALSDSGTFDSTFIIGAQKQNCFDNPSIDWTFTGSSGSVTMHGTGSSCIDGSNRGIFDAKFTITGGTGTYANLSGKGSATGEIDLNDGTFTTVFDGTAHFAH
jgi:hypothetical protein